MKVRFASLVSLVAMLSPLFGGAAFVHAAGAAPGSSTTFEVILRDDVGHGEAPSFEVVRTDLAGLAGLVASVEPGQTIEANGTAYIVGQPTDPEYPGQWEAEALGLPSAWDVTLGDAGTTVAVLDTGVAPTANLGDRLLPGVSFVGGDVNVDPPGHGSWVAALIGASHDQTGIAGVCPSCNILPVQVGDEFGRVPWSAAAAGITWAVDNGADIINLSFGGSSPSQTLQDAVAYAVANDVVVVAAAGNDGTNAEFYPAAFPSVLAVAAHDQAGERYAWSNYGPWVDVAAPGCALGELSGDYVTICGTSFASPLVSGVVALLAAQRGDLTPATAEGIIEPTTIGVDWVETGRLDAAALLALPVQPAPAAAPPVTSPASGPVAMPFDDVDPTAYYAEPVAWLVATGATTGTSPATFSPNDSVTRGQFATFLWRLEDKPAAATASAFVDVDPTAYYASPVAWLAATGATTGTSPTTFSPLETVTRGQLATFLWRLDGSPATPLDARFVDVNPTAYYAEAVAWLAATGATTGTGPTTFSPDDTVTRGQFATFLWRLRG